MDNALMDVPLKALNVSIPFIPVCTPTDEVPMRTLSYVRPDVLAFGNMYKMREMLGEFMCKSLTYRTEKIFVLVNNEKVGRLIPLQK